MSNVDIKVECRRCGSNFVRRGNFWQCTQCGKSINNAKYRKYLGEELEPIISLKSKRKYKTGDYVLIEYPHNVLPFYMHWFHLHYSRPHLIPFYRHNYPANASEVYVVVATGMTCNNNEYGYRYDQTPIYALMNKRGNIHLVNGGNIKSIHRDVISEDALNVLDLIRDNIGYSKKDKNKKSKAIFELMKQFKE
jgi:ribosomal protein L37E